jgi:hypothetical protein
MIVFCEHGNVAEREKTYTKSMEMENTYNRDEKGHRNLVLWKVF